MAPTLNKPKSTIKTSPELLVQKGGVMKNNILTAHLPFPFVDISRLNRFILMLKWCGLSGKPEKKALPSLIVYGTELQDSDLTSLRNLSLKIEQENGVYHQVVNVKKSKETIWITSFESKELCWEWWQKMAKSLSSMSVLFEMGESLDNAFGKIRDQVVSDTVNLT